MTIQNDPLAIYRIGKMGVQAPINPPDLFEEEESENALDQYRIKPRESEEYNLKDIPRIGLGHAARAAETAAGLPGGYQKGMGTLLDYVIGGGTEKITGKKQPKLRQLLKDPYSSLGKHREAIEELEKESLLPGETSMFTQYPTAEEIKELITKPLSKALTENENILEPRSEAERAGQEFTQTLTQLALPGSGIQGWLQRAGLATLGQTGKETAKLLGFEPSTQELAKMGVIGIASLAQIGNAPKFARQYFQNVRNVMPRGVRFNASLLQNTINRLKQSEWYRVGNPASTRAAKSLIDDLEKQIQNGTMSARDAMRMREVINEAAENLGAFAVDKAHKVSHVSHVNEVRDALINGMEQTLGHQYPNWWKTYQDANAVYGITQNSTRLGQWIANNYAKPVFSDAGKVLFGNALAKGAAGITKLGIAGASIASGAKLIQLTNRLARSPTLRKYYEKVLITAAKNDSLAMSEALRKFDEYALKEEKHEKAIRPLRNPSQK